MPSSAIPIHYDDYGVFRSPLADFRVALAERGLSELLDVVEPGETRTLAGTSRSGRSG